MTVTVVGQWQARAGQEQAFLATATGLLADAHGPLGLRAARVLQSTVSPAHFVVLGEWTSREAFTARIQRAGEAALLALSREAPTRHFYECLQRFEDLTQPLGVLGGALVTASPAALAATQKFLLQEAGALARALPGMLLRVVYRDVEDAHHFFVLHGWSTAEASQRSITQLAPQMQGRLQALGATVDRFLGHSRVELGAVRSGTSDAAPDSGPAPNPRAIAVCVDTLLAGYDWSTNTRHAVLQLAAHQAEQWPQDWEPRLRAAWVQASEPLRASGRVVPGRHPADWALMEQFVVEVLERALQQLA